MRVIVLDPNVASREVLSLRVGEALRQAAVRRSEVIQAEFHELSSIVENDEPLIGFLGPGCYAEIEKSVAKFRAALPTTPLALVLDNEVYPVAAVELRRELSVRIMPLADIVQMVQFILDYEKAASGEHPSLNRGLVSVAQLKGGVGATTIAAAIASCWAEHDLSVALIDIDDVNPHLTTWGKVTSAKKRVLSEFLQNGEVPPFRVNEIVHPIASRAQRLFVVGQPERYQESFHFKADVLDSIPSSAEFIESLVTALREEFDIIVADLGRSWGISAFALLRLSQQVVFVMDDKETTVRRSIENLARLYRESDDPDEFDFTRWRVVLNGYTGNALSAKSLMNELEHLDLFPKSTSLYVVPASRQGRDWSLSEQSFWDAADPEARHALTDLAFGIAPFKRHDLNGAGVINKLKRQLNRFVGA